MNLSPNWICRDVVVVFVSWPKVGNRFPLPSNIRRKLRLGASKFGWFKMLKTSVRNCSSPFSEIRKCLFTRKSIVERRGPIRVFRPKFPKVPSDWGVKAHGSNQWLGVPTGVPGAIVMAEVPVPKVQPAETPDVGLLLAPVTRFGRSEKFEPVAWFWERLAESSTVNGTPVEKVPIPPICHPLISSWPTPLRLFPNGSS